MLSKCHNGVKNMETKYSSKSTFSKLESNFGKSLKCMQTTIRFTNDVNSFVDKMNQANKITGNSKLVFK